jgi:hypothetical protein
MLNPTTAWAWWGTKPLSITPAPAMSFLILTKEKKPTGRLHSLN